MAMSPYTAVPINQLLGTSLQTGTASNNLVYQNQALGAGIASTYTPYTPAVRNQLSDQCALAVYNNRIVLKDAAKEMPGDYDENRKLLGDVFLMASLHLTVEQAASLAFVFRLETGEFLRTCEQVGALVPARE